MTDAIDRYQLVGEIARGGMGVVYRAYDPIAGREVALKVLLPGFADQIDVLRLQREAQAAAKVAHPGIVAVHDLGRTDDGRPFVVFDLVRGQSLQHHLDTRGPFPPAQAAQLTERVARALHAAHQAGVLHRDVKPANVLLNESGDPLLTDFGLAKLVDAKDTGLTATGEILGTPTTMSPEQAYGDAAAIGPLTDVYALGALLYALLTAHPPFPPGPLINVLQAVINERPKVPSSWRAQVSPELDAICLRCMEKDPGKRYSSAEAFADDLRRVTGDESLSRPRRPALTLATLGGAALVVAVAVALVTAREQRLTPSVVNPTPTVVSPTPPASVASTTTASPPPDDDRPLVARLASSRIKEAFELTLPHGQARMRQFLKENMDQLESSSEFLRASLLIEQGGILLRLGKTEDALAALNASLDQEQQPKAYYYRGLALARLLKFEAAEADLRKAVSAPGDDALTLQQVHSPSDQFVAWGYLGMLQEVKGEVEEAARCYGFAIELNPFPSSWVWWARRGFMLKQDGRDPLYWRCDLLKAQGLHGAVSDDDVAPGELPAVRFPASPKVARYPFLVGRPRDSRTFEAPPGASGRPTELTLRAIHLLGVKNAPEKWREGMKILTTALHEAPQTPFAWTTRAEARYDVGDLEGSERDFSQVVQLAGNPNAKLRVLSRALYQRGFVRLQLANTNATRLGDAQADFHSAMNLRGAVGRPRLARTLYAYTLWRQGKIEGADELLSKIADDPRGRRPGVATLAKGILLTLRKRHAEAIEHLRSAHDETDKLAFHRRLLIQDLIAENREKLKGPPR